MHLNNITRGLLPLILIVGLFKITGIDAAGNQKETSDDSKQASDTYDEDYSDEPVASNGEDAAPKTIIEPYFEKTLNTVYVTKDVENVTLECLPHNFVDNKHQILWYNDENPITNGKTSLQVDKYSVDNKYRLTILNYSKDFKGNVSCAVLPSDIRQYVAIEFGTPPDNITSQNGGSSNTHIVEMGLLLSSLIATVYFNYCKF